MAQIDLAQLAVATVARRWTVDAKANAFHRVCRSHRRQTVDAKVNAFYRSAVLKCFWLEWP